jgi:hypothetical protein
MSERVVCTIITKSYVPYARTLANALAEYDPNSKLFVLLADKVDGYFEPDKENFNLIRLEDLPEQETVEKMCFYYTPFELCCALRGMLHEYMFEHTAIESWLFLDSDIMIFSSLEEIFQKLQKTSILLNMHCNTPVDVKYVDPYEFSFLRSGLYNGGFLGLRRTDESKKFISWFKTRLTKFCFDDLSIGEVRGLFVDQLWLNLIPLYFKDVSFCLEPGVNLGHWNLFERALKKDFNGKFTVNDKPLFFFHFSGWDISNPYKVSKYSPIDSENTPPVWIELSEIYKEKLLRNDYKTFAHFPYAFNYFHGGELITLTTRRMYYNELMQDIEIKGSPFENYLYFESKLHPQNSKTFFQRIREAAKQTLNALF